MDTRATAPIKFDLEAARRIVGQLADLIRPACEKLEVAGSIRRGTPYVKDADLVAIPRPHLLPLLDDLLARGIVEKALYGETKSTRWGPKLRGMIFQGLQVEIDLADEHNWGYKKALRSGPKEANEYIMAFINWKKPALRLQGGYGWYSPHNWWEKPKGKWFALDQVRLSIPDEDTLFALLGMPYIPPGERTEQRYKKLLAWNRGHQWPDFAPFVVKAPITPKMVEVQPAAVFGEKLKPDAMTRLSPLGVTDANAATWAAQVYRESQRECERRITRYRQMAGTYPSYARLVERAEGELEVLRGLAQGLRAPKSL